MKYPKINQHAFIGDLAEYLKAEEQEQKEKSWSKLVENYPFKALGNNRYKFLPSEHEEFAGSGRVDYLVEKPLTETGSAIDYVSGDLYDNLSDYMLAEDAINKLEKLAELEDQYDSEWTSETTVRFGPTVENGVEVRVPGLRELAQAYNERGDLGLDEDEKEMLSTIATRSSKVAGTMEKTLYVQDSELWVEDSNTGEFYPVERPGEAVSLREMIETYEMARDAPDPQTMEHEIFEVTKELFGVGQHGDYQLMIDTENDDALLFDTSTVKLEIMELEEADEWLEKFPGENPTKIITDFYNRVTQSGR